jgi:hypothetical protein
MADMQQALSIEVLLQLWPGTLLPCCISTPFAFHALDFTVSTPVARNLSSLE